MATRDGHSDDDEAGTSDDVEPMEDASVSPDSRTTDEEEMAVTAAIGGAIDLLSTVLHLQEPGPAQGHEPTSGRRGAISDRTRSRRGPVKLGPRRIDEISVSAIVVGEKVQNARVRQDEEKQESLRSSVSADGIDSPVGVVEDDVRPGKFHLIWGSRRLRAARDVGLDGVPAIILPAGTPRIDLEFAHFRENTCRSNLSSYEMAARCAHLIDTYGCTVAFVSMHTGVPQGTIAIAFDSFAPPTTDRRGLEKRCTGTRPQDASSARRTARLRHRHLPLDRAAGVLRGGAQRQDRET